MSILGTLWTLAAFIVTLGILVTFHEWGHYLAARYCGVKVLRFCLGFGRPIVSVRRGADNTEWALAAIPLGGYVKFLDEAEAPVAAHELDRAFNRQSLGKRAFIVVAGPAFNLLLAVFLYWAMFVHGVAEPRPILAEPPAASLAARAGVHAQDSVSAVNGQAVVSWVDLRWLILQEALNGRPVELTVTGVNGRHATLMLDLSSLQEEAVEGKLFDAAGIQLYYPLLPAVIGEVRPNSAAALANLQKGDRVLTIEGKPVVGWQDMSAAIRAAPGRPLLLQIERAGRRFFVNVTPEADAKDARIGRIGVVNQPQATWRDELMIEVKYNAFNALPRAFAKTWDTSLLTLRMIGRLLIGEISVKNISGPITIADYAGKSAQIGWNSYLSFLALLSISLGVLNLLPIPLLDGGHLLYYLAEFIRGKPLTERVMDVGRRVGIGVLVLLMTFAFYNDLNRLFFG